jgi:outer membrane protein TolC
LAASFTSPGPPAGGFVLLKIDQSWLRSLLAAALGVMAVGCASAVPNVNASDSAAAAAGLREPIRFHTEGEPIDVPPLSASVLSQPEAVRLALTHDPDIQAAMARVRAALADAKQVRLLPNPVLSVVLRWPSGGGKPDIEAGLAADLISLLSRPGHISAADSRLRAAAAEVLTVTLDVLAEVQTQYAAVQASDELLTVLDDRVRVLDRLLGVARSRLEAGEGTRLDLLALEAQRVELHTDLADRQLDRTEQRLSLARMIGTPSAAADWNLTPYQSDDRPLGAESKWMTAALDHRPEMSQQRFALAAFGQEVRLAAFTPFDGTDVGVDAERDGDWAVGPGVSLPVPLFDFGQSRRDRAEASVTEARHQLTRLGRRIVEQTRRAYAAVNASRDNVRRVESEWIPIAERRLEQAETQYRGGQTDITGLLLAEEELRSARTRRVELQQRCAEALIRLQRAVGGPMAMTAVSPTPTTQPSAEGPLIPILPDASSTHPKD